MRAPSYVTHLDQLPGQLPIVPIEKDVDLEAVSVDMISKLSTLSKDLFTSDALWRDQMAMCGTLRTFYSPERIMPSWNLLAKEQRPQNFKYTPHSAYLQPGGTWVQAMFTFDTQATPKLACSGIVYVIKVESEWKIWLLCTIGEDLIGHESVDLRKEPSLNGLINGVNGLANGHSEDAEQHFDAIIVGGGQGGLATGAWCQSYGVKYVVLERNKQIGDNWLNRYDSAKLHTGQRFNDLPFGPTFTKDDPEWLTTKALANGYQRFVKQFGINVWTSATIDGICEWDAIQKIWNVKVRHDGKLKRLVGKHLVLATGPGGQVPMKPNLPGEESFKGEVLHSINYKNASAWKGKKGVVVGTANTANDVCEDMVKAGLTEITMLQRGNTYVVPRHFFKQLFDMIWNDYLPQEVSDRLFWSPPTGISRHMTNAYLWPLHDKEPDLENALDKVGFRCLRQADFLDHLLIRFGGHYMISGASFCSQIDVGNTPNILSGRVKIKGDSPLIGFTPTGLQFGDGSTIETDVVVFATGFDKDIKYSASQILGDKLAANMERYWGVDEEGEVGLAFKRNSIDNFFVVGGGCSHCRYFTRFVALQIKADVLGTPLPIYEGSPVE